MQFLATVALSDCGHLALCGHKGLSNGVHLKNDIDKIVTVYDNGKSVTVIHGHDGSQLILGDPE